VFAGGVFSMGSGSRRVLLRLRPGVPAVPHAARHQPLLPKSLAKRDTASILRRCSEVYRGKLPSEFLEKLTLGCIELVVGKNSLLVEVGKFWKAV